MSFAMVWLVVLVLLNPAVIVAELFGKQIFAVWTHGKIPFDFALFAGLSSGILIYALAQPAMAILQGNNLIWLQLAFSALTSTVAVAGIWISIGRFGISGVGVVLAISEFCGLIAYLRAGMRWLAAHDMKWPWRLFAISSTAVLITVVSLYLMAVAVSKDFVAACCLFLQAMFAIAYWRVLPEDAKERIRRILPGRLKWDLRG